jgi:hypothetical protein
MKRASSMNNVTAHYCNSGQHFLKISMAISGPSKSAQQKVRTRLTQINSSPGDVGNSRICRENVI